MRLTAVLVLGCAFLLASPSQAAKPRPETLVASAQDHRDIEALLAAYTQAVSTKDEALFEKLILDKNIPFSYVAEDSAKVAHAGTANYESFRKGAFESGPFTQTFKDVSIEQDGNLANVRLVFVNKTAASSSWGWKTLQLLKVSGTWKIASEFYTVH